MELIKSQQKSRQLQYCKKWDFNGT